jgi:hypothetical protein
VPGQMIAAESVCNSRLLPQPITLGTSPSVKRLQIDGT